MGGSRAAEQGCRAFFRALPLGKEGQGALSYHPRHSKICEVLAAPTAVCSALGPPYESTSTWPGGFLGEKHDRQSGWINRIARRYRSLLGGLAFAGEDMPAGRCAQSCYCLRFGHVSNEWSDAEMWVPPGSAQHKAGLWTARGSAPIHERGD
jgi:hypothetical protein